MTILGETSKRPQTTSCRSLQRLVHTYLRLAMTLPTTVEMRFTLGFLIFVACCMLAECRSMDVNEERKLVRVPRRFLAVIPPHLRRYQKSRIVPHQQPSQVRPRVDCPPCDSTDTDSSVPWSIDTGNPPDSITGGPPVGDWDNVFTSPPSSDNLEEESETEANPWITESGGTDTENEASDPWDINNGGSETETNNEAGKNDPWNTNNGGSETETNNGGIDNANGDQEAPLCTCMSVIECGATFRSGDYVESEEASCPVDGDICCVPSSTQVPPSEVTSSGEATTSTLRCGQSKIFPGIEASAPRTSSTAEFGEFPWTALLYSKDIDEENNGNGDFRCGGSLVHPLLVVTAAHCVVKERMEAIRVRLGDWDLIVEDRTEPLPSVERSVERLIIHENFKSGSPPYDIAVIVLSSPVPLTENINPICIPTGYEDYDATQCSTSGWGEDPTGASVNLMKKIDMSIVPRRECTNALKTSRLGPYFKLHKTFICAGGGNKDACIGFGGGPLACSMKESGDRMLVGITSWGIGCGSPDLPGVYIDVVQLHDWLLQTMRSVVPDA